MLCIPEQCAFVCEGHVLERCVALGRKLRHLQLLPHQSTKGLIVSARSRCIYAWLWGHPSLNNSWPSPCFGASFYQNGGRAAKIRSVCECALATSGHLPHIIISKHSRPSKRNQKYRGELHSKTIPKSGSVLAFKGWFTRLSLLFVLMFSKFVVVCFPSGRRAAAEQ